MRLIDLMNNPQKLELIRELAETGASVAVIEAKLQLKSGSISTWLAKGESNKRTIYARFRSLFRSWAAESTYAAQQQLLVKNPGKWLETSSTAKVVENVKSTGLVPTTGNTQSISRPNLAAEALAAAMKVLIESKNIDAKDIVDVEEISKEDG
jgi:hypothetical protein